MMAPDMLSGTLSVVAYGQGKAVAVGGGTNRYLHRQNPTSLHQRVEMQFTFAPGGYASAYTGLIARYRDSGNYVRARVSHNPSTLQAEIVERIAGVDTVRGSISWSGGHGTMPTGAAIRLELIGRRARLWYEQKPRPVVDRPPDLAVDLATEPTQAGQWGLYTSSAIDARLLSFAARDLPALVLPPPSVAFGDASGLNLTSINASVSEVSATASELEWEVYPADPDDYPEAYRDRTLASITSRFFWVRPGFAYDVRVREHGSDGSLGAWTPFQRITAWGTKSGIEAPVVPTIEFPPVVPSYVLPRQQNAQVNATVSETGREKVVGFWPAPRNHFELVFENRQPDEYQQLIDFFEEMAGRKTAFAWTHPTTGRKYALRFDSDEYTLRYDDCGEEGSIVHLSFDVAEVYLGTMIQVGANLASGADVTVDGECLVDQLNALAEATGNPLQRVDRQGRTGALNAQDFNSLSQKTAFYAQNWCVSDYDNPDSWIDYQAVTVASDGEITQRRLQDISQALRKMKYRRVPGTFQPHQFTRVRVTYPTYSDDNAELGYDYLVQYWGQNLTTTTADGFTVEAASGPTNTPPAPVTLTLGYTPTGTTSACTALKSFVGSGTFSIPFDSQSIMETGTTINWLKIGDSFQDAEAGATRRWIAAVTWDSATSYWDVLLTTQILQAGSWTQETLHTLSFRVFAQATGFTHSSSSPTPLTTTGCCGAPAALSSGGLTATPIPQPERQYYGNGFHLVRITQNNGLQIEGYVYNSQLAFARNPQGSRVFVKARACADPDDEGVVESLPNLAFYDALNGGQDTWTLVQEDPAGMVDNGSGLGDVLPTRDGFLTGVAAFSDAGLSLTASARSDAPTYIGQGLTVQNELRGQFAGAGFTLAASAQLYPFGRVSYSNVSAIQLSGAAAGLVIRGQSADTEIAICSAQTNQVGRVGLLVEQSSLQRLYVASFSNDGVFRVVGDLMHTLSEVVFDGCTGKIEILGTPGSVSDCYVNRHVGGYEQVAASIMGMDGTKPGVRFIRGLPLNRVGTSPAPTIFPLAYPQPGETLSVGWRLTDIAVLVPIPDIAPCGYVATDPYAAS
jgi:hypothetical protein